LICFIFKPNGHGKFGKVDRSVDNCCCDFFFSSRMSNASVNHQKMLRFSLL